MCSAADCDCLSLPPGVLARREPTPNTEAPFAPKTPTETSGSSAASHAMQGMSFHAVCIPIKVRGLTTRRQEAPFPYDNIC